MPTVSGKYVAPTWVDDGPPALNATELQAMSDGIEWLDNKAGVVVYVETFTASASVKMTYNGTTTTATADSNGTATFYPSAYGTYTFTYGSNTTTLTVDQVKIYTVFVFDDLETATWTQISDVSEAGDAASVWSIGDTKSFTMNSTTYYAQIIGFNHDELVDGSGSIAGITFQMQNCYGTTYYMNSSSTNVGGWTSSYMRQTVMANLLSACPSDMQDVIKAVPKKTSAGNSSSTITTTTDSLWLLAEIEVFGSITYSYSGEGTQYEYYEAGNSRVKMKDTSAYAWWLRSPYSGYSSAFCYVNSGGGGYHYSAGLVLGVAFGFCV